MEWVKLMRLGNVCCSVTNKLLITNTWYWHKSKHQCTWDQNDDHSNPGHMIDYVHISAKYRSSSLDTHVYRKVHHQSDHELIVSTLRFKIKTDASGNSPSLPRKKEADWITEEVRSLSRKKKEAWVRLWNTPSSDSDQHSAAMAEYCRFTKLTKVTAEKARNAC